MRVGVGAGFGNAGRGGGTVVTVGNVDNVLLVESGGNRGDIRVVVNHPQSVANGVVARDFVSGGGLNGFFDNRVDFGNLPVCQQSGPCLRVQSVDLAHAVVFFVNAGEFVAADAVFVILGNACRDRQSRLDVVAHNRAVNVIARLFILFQNAFFQQSAVVFGGFGVHRGRIRVGVFGQIDFSLRNM